MKAAWYTSLGTSSVLQVGELPTPEPGPGEVRVRLAVSGVNPSDWKARLRGRGGSIAFPQIVPQSDGAGTIDKVGAGVDTTRIGEKVWVLNGQWKRPHGTAAQYIAINAGFVAPLPAGVDPAEAACFGIPALTAWRALTIAGGVAGQVVLVTGGAGAVGHHAIQIARALGAAKIVATVSSPEKAAIAREAGADATIDYRKENLGERVKSLTGGSGADRIVDLNISTNGPHYADMLRQGGAIVVYGTDEPMASIPAGAFIPLAPSIHFFIVYDLASDLRHMGMAEINALAAAGKLKTVIARRFPLDRIAEAHDAVQSGKITGNVVLDIP
ncbi:MAG: NADPH:quinone reductase [Alphaproteobacteria bacterium]|nr:NADPH:quinone reductase [Alphaproteobacteria bacterium]